MQDKAPRNSEGQKHGLWERYYDNGKLIYKGLYIDGYMFGKHEAYQNDGTLYYIMNFINNERYGYYEYKHAKIYYAR